ncbi:hypothetical protein AVEN_32292-1, partial [Araneus ventricosus]
MMTTIPEQDTCLSELHQSIIGRLTINTFVNQITLDPHVWQFLDRIGFRIWYQSGPEAESLPPGHLGLCFSEE